LTFVLDASITLAWCFDDEDSVLADQVVARIVNEDAVAPVIWPLELANSFLSAERRGRTSISQTRSMLDVVQGLRVTLHQVHFTSGLEDVIMLGREESLSAYDASYVHLALANGLPLATLDSRLKVACEQVGVPLLVS
jgi:predicted nucleic acid-binding protein